MPQQVIEHDQIVRALDANNNVATYDLDKTDWMRERFTKPDGRIVWGPAIVMVTRHADGVTVSVGPKPSPTTTPAAAFDVALNVEVRARGSIEETLGRAKVVESAIKAAGAEVWATGYGFGVRDLSVDCTPGQLAAVMSAVFVLEPDALVTARRKGTEE